MSPPVKLFLLLGAALSILIGPGAPEARNYPRKTPVVEAVEKVGPAVVNISSRETLERRSFPNFRMDPLFEEFFRDFFDPGPGRRFEHNSLGSGVIIDGGERLVLTNAHVVANTGRITVTLQDQREFGARLVGTDPESDLAILRIDTSESLPAVRMGDSDDLMIGETVIAIGNPFGFSHTVTTGVISAIGRSIRTEDRVYHSFIQTDASINPGNSGGPLLNINGELIGINTAIYAKAQGIGFAIPINHARRITEDLIRYGEVKPAWIGLMVQDVDRRLARYLNLPGTGGAIVKAMDPGSPAVSAGFENGDVVLSVDGAPIESARDYQLAMRSTAPGKRVTVEVWREGRSRTLQVTAGRFPMAQAESLGFRLLGIRVDEVAPDTGGPGAGFEGGVRITEVRPGTYLSRIGVRPGDLLRRIDDIPIQSVEDFRKTMVQYRHKSSAVLLVQRGDRGYYITVSL